MSEEIQIHFTVAHRVVPYVRTTRRQKYVDPRYARYRDYKEIVGTIALQALQKNPRAYCAKGERVQTYVTAYIRGKRRIDGDNILKAIHDAINAILYEDDSQVVKSTIEKVSIGKEEEERVEVRVIKL